MHVIQRLIPWVIVSAVCYAAIWLWQGLAIMPDEIAIRIQAGHFLQDNGTAFGLYALCADRIKELPWIFMLPAWLFSIIDLHASSMHLRIASMASLTFCLMAAASYTVMNANRMAVWWLAAAVMGVAASTLIYFRFETFITFNLGFVVLGMLALRYNAPPFARYACAAILFLSLLFMAYTHPQAQLFIPLNAYITYRLLAGNAISPVLIAALTALFGYVGYESHTFFELSCKAYPGIEAFWKQMIIDPALLQHTHIIDMLAPKFETFTSAFLYKDNYKINYLPGLPADILSQDTILALNAALPIALGVIIASGFVVAAVFAYSFIKTYFFKPASPRPFPLDGAVCFGLIFFPAIFYFLYDANLYFYRAHFLNFLFVFALAIGLSHLQGRWMHYVTLVLGIALLVLTLQSSNANNTLFAPKLNDYEGPSTSMTNKWIVHPQDALAFANSCGIDVTQGGGIVSDTTHAIAKPYYRVYPMTYLNLQMSLAGIKAPEAIRILKPHYVLGRCTEMEQSGLGWPADKRSDDLCCTKLDRK